MTLLRLAAAAALIALVTAGLFVAGGGPRPSDAPPNPAASLPAQAPVATPSLSPAASPTVAGPTATPIWTSPPLSERYTSKSLGYSMPVPPGYTGEPARGAWDYTAPTDDSSPWLEHMWSPDHLAIITARSASLGRAMTTDEWLDAFLASPGAPYSADDCKVAPVWDTIPVGSASGRYYHEPCGLLWVVVADGDRGYVFTMSFNVYDTPYLADPFVAAFKEMLAGTELTPATPTT